MDADSNIVWKKQVNFNLIYFFSSCNVCGHCEPNSLRLIPRVAQICSQMKKYCSAVGTIRFTWITEGFHSLSCCQRELAIQQTGFLPKLTLRAKSPTSYNISHMRTHYKLIGAEHMKQRLFLACLQYANSVLTIMCHTVNLKYILYNSFIISRQSLSVPCVLFCYK